MKTISFEVHDETYDYFKKHADRYKMTVDELAKKYVIQDFLTYSKYHKMEDELTNEHPYAKDNDGKTIISNPKWDD